MSMYLIGGEGWLSFSLDFLSSQLHQIHSSLYLQQLGKTTKSHSAVEETVYAISWIHQMAGVSLPSDDPFIQILAGLRSSLAKPTVKKECITCVALEHKS